LWSRCVSAYGAPPTALDMGEQEEVLPAAYVALYKPSDLCPVVDLE
jgi:hypothetical protein